jgi:uncharacterized coiled-coil protein SlyX
VTPATGRERVPLPPVLRRRFIPILVLLGAVLGVTTIAPGAGAQDAVDRKEQLERRKVDLDARISAEDRTIAEIQSTVDAKQAELSRWAVQLELAADEYARTVDARREPARTRVLIAIDAYIRGDPRVTSLIAEIIRMDTRSEEITQRELYRAVVEDADRRLRAVDGRLREMSNRVVSLQAASKSVRDQLAAAQEKHQAALEARQRLAAERAGVIREIEDIISRARRAVLTGTLGFENPDRPALAVKIDNVEAARPQAGINQADVVFEEEVEGGLTRLAAVFHSRGSDPVGPVRSVRTTDINMLALLNRPLFSSSGGNPGARAQLLASTLVDVGQSAYPDAYYREPRTPPHNLFTRTTTLWQAAQDLGGRPQALFSFLAPDAPRPRTALAAGGVQINFGSTRVEYAWNGRGWARTQNGRGHVDTKGVQVAPANVIVQFTNYGISDADERSPEALVVGSGEAWVFTNGYLVRGRWTRRSAGAVTTYNDELGNPIALTPGSTWIALPRPASSTLR